VKLLPPLTPSSPSLHLFHPNFHLYPVAIDYHNPLAKHCRSCYSILAERRLRLVVGIRFQYLAACSAIRLSLRLLARCPRPLRNLSRYA